MHIPASFTYGQSLAHLDMRTRRSYPTLTTSQSSPCLTTAQSRTTSLEACPRSMAPWILTVFLVPSPIEISFKCPVGVVVLAYQRLSCCRGKDSHETRTIRQPIHSWQHKVIPLCSSPDTSEPIGLLNFSPIKQDPLSRCSPVISGLESDYFP
jgi:hypothetical protein